MLLENIMRKESLNPNPDSDIFDDDSDDFIREPFDEEED